jgi:ABC-type glycerol-3-phosphate transport system substrate-binding protein
MPIRTIVGMTMLAVCLLLAGCGNASSEPGSLSGSEIEAGVRADLELVVLHTNDNWGETEPCG